MLGPLPTFYRVIVSGCALLSFAGIGAWLGLQLPPTIPASIGIGLGAGLGIVVVLLLNNDTAYSGRHRGGIPSQHRH